MLEKIIHLLKQRRVWASIVGVAVFALSLLSIDLDVDQELLVNNLETIGIALASLLQGGLALWSYLSPKVTKAKR